MEKEANVSDQLCSIERSPAQLNIQDGTNQSQRAFAADASFKVRLRNEAPNNAC